MQITIKNIYNSLKVIILLVSPVFVSCNYTKHLGANEYLLQSNKIEFEKAEDVENKTLLTESMLTLMQQKPNSNLLDVDVFPRYKLWRYNSRYDFYQKNPKNTKIRERKVEPPVIVNKRSTIRTDSTLKKFLVNNGYFYAEVRDSIIYTKKNEAKVVYTITPGKVYYIKDIVYETDNKNILAVINKYKKGSRLKIGNQFRKIDIGYERERLYRKSREDGMYALKAENIWAHLDTVDRSQLKDAFNDAFGLGDISKASVDNDSLVIYMHFSETRDKLFGQKFTIGDVAISFNDFEINKEFAPKKNEERYKGVIFRYNHLPVNKEVIVNNLFMHSGDVYSANVERATYNRLNQLGTFQFVNIRYQRNSVDSTVLDCLIDVTLAPKQDIQTNVDLSNSDDYFLGFGLGVNYSTKNLWKGANKLNLSTAYAIETRLSDNEGQGLFKRLFLNANNFNVTANLSFPKFLVPFKLKHSKSNYPFTILSLAYNRVNRVDVFLLVNTTATLSYNWKETEKKSWLLSPIFLSYTRVPENSLSEAFQEQLSNSRFLQNTYSNNFIQGENVTYEYKSDLTGLARNSHTLKLGLEEAGLLMSGVNALYQSITSDSISPIAHYLRLDADYRHYYNRSKSQLASRAMIGFGLPTFGDLSLPYIKQYSQGGAFSNRGWRLRNLGPGRQALDTSSGRQIVDRTGDIKLELNTEYRFNIAPLFGGAFNLKGAAFVDAGNIWLWDEDSTNIGAKIDPAFLWQDIAISAGLGMRLDFSFFVFRLDHGWPIKHPYIPTNSGWDFKGVRLNSGQWNLAIGYPF